ncbi:hypothetical protein COT48_00700 [Candidatus Woesearchaeota archaeon CG08_land_8_20_14_0_20_47_9]|nr:MAG: hypothetical protein COT48_00700 [Candidatus Woesearchaeota archaeon CG08_land_8_20_14_0_20_47_9]
MQPKREKADETVKQMQWFEKLDFYDNPFSIDTDIEDELIGVDDILDELYYRVESGSIVFLEGQAGTGKTAVLKKVIGRFMGSKQVIFFDCKEIPDKRLNIERLMFERYGTIGKLLRLTPKNMILLLDNVPALSKKNTERAKFFFDQDFIKAIVLTGKSYSRLSMSEGIKERIGSRVIKLRRLTPEQVVELVNYRLGDAKLMNEETVKTIFKRSRGNLKRFLEYCDMACQIAVNSKSKRVKTKHLKKLFGGGDE